MTITECTHQEPQKLDSDYVESMPTFIVGTIKQQDGQHNFKRKVALDLDGLNTNHQHIDGLNLETIPRDGSDFDASQIKEDLYAAIYDTEVYRQAAKAYHGC